MMTLRLLIVHVVSLPLQFGLVQFNGDKNSPYKYNFLFI